MRFLNPEHTLVRTADGRMVPVDPANVDWQRIVASGEPVAAYEPPAVNADDVRRECSRRMQMFVGARDAAHLAVILSNAQREAARLHSRRIGIPGVVAAREWTPDEAARAAALYVADAEIERLRAVSNTLEISLPADYASDSHWVAP